MANNDTRTTEGKISVMQRAKDGKPLQYILRDGNSGWRDCAYDFTIWNWSHYDYRIRPEPREWCLRVTEEGKPTWELWNPSMAGTGIHVREVLP